MAPATPSYSLDYFEALFGSRTAEFWELVSALIEELSGYGAGVRSEAEAGNRAEVARLRHDHRPLVENLRLATVRLLEEELLQAMDGENLETRRKRGRALATEVLSVARALTSERLRAFPEPRPPSHGD